MVSQTEQTISRLLRAILAELPNGADILQTESFREVLLDLEWFIPGILRAVHPEWERESLDGVYAYLARKTGDREAEISGQCILITDQTMTPIHLRVQIASSQDEISWLECRLGEQGKHGMVRTPYPSNVKKLVRLQDDIAMRGFDGIDWAYKVTFGEKED
jgi:hypothetical protein